MDYFNSLPFWTRECCGPLVCLCVLLCVTLICLQPLWAIWNVLNLHVGHRCVYFCVESDIRRGQIWFEIMGKSTWSTAHPSEETRASEVLLLLIFNYVGSLRGTQSLTNWTAHLFKSLHCPFLCLANKCLLMFMHRVLKKKKEKESRDSFRKSSYWMDFVSVPTRQVIWEFSDTAPAAWKELEEQRHGAHVLQTLETRIRNSPSGWSEKGFSHTIFWNWFRVWWLRTTAF